MTDIAPPSLKPFLDRSRSLDPRNPTDAEELVRILSAPGGPDPRFREVAFRCTEAPAGSDLFVLAHALAGMYLSHELDAVEASSHFRVALAVCYGKGDRLEAAVCLNLALCSLRLGREYEALVASRRAAENCLARGEDLGLGHSLLHIAQAALEMRRWDVFGSALDRLEALLPALPGPSAELMHRLILGCRADAALTRGEGEECLRLVAQTDAVGPNASKLWSPLFRAHALAYLSRFEEAGDLLMSIPAGEIEGPWRFRHGFVDAFLRVRRDGDDPVVREFIESLESPEARRLLGAGRRGEMAVEIGRALEAAGGPGERVQRALEIAAASLLERLGELDRFLTDLPAFANPDEEVRGMLSDHRLRLTREQRDVLDAAGSLFAAAYEAGDPVLGGLVEDSSFICVCAWCGRVRVRNRAWMPLGQLLLLASPFSLTHGICPACRSRTGFGR